MPDSFENSKRIKALRRDLIAAVPRFPNDKASRHAIEAKKLTDLLVTFIGWRLRHVGMRQRQIAGAASLAGDPRAAALKPNIDAFLEVVRSGCDLTPYLSIEPRTKGYTPAAAAPRAAGGDSWADKDFLLNVMGLHHFHLGLTMEAAGHAKRTNELIFASVTRDTFEIIGLVDHAAFEYEAEGSMTAGRKALWSMFEDRQVANSLPGQLTFGGFGGLGITTSSQPVVVVRAAIEHIRVMRETDPKLDNPQFVQSLYTAGPTPAKPKLKWQYHHLDLGLLDEHGRFFIFRNGPN